MARMALAGQMAGDLDRLLGGHGAEAYCLECAGLASPSAGDAKPVVPQSGWLALLLSFAH